MRDDDFIVSKTDLKGRITYANKIFKEFSGFEEHEYLGKQHNVIRHPDMPRCVFKLLWDHIQGGKEIFAFVKKRFYGMIMVNFDVTKRIVVIAQNFVTRNKFCGN